MRARSWTWLLGAAATFWIWGGEPAVAVEEGVSVVLELSQHFYYEGDPLLVRVSVRNSGTSPVANPVAVGLLEGLKVRRAGGSRLRPALAVDSREPDRPDTLAPDSFYGSLIDISGLFPQTLEAGHYEMMWEGDGLESRILAARVIPRFDPDADYFGEIVTALGTIRLDLFEERSPVAVKAFVDLAHAGYYDGLGIDEVRQDQLIAGGQAPAGQRPFMFPAEQSNVPLIEGTVVLKPTEAAPPTNGAGFMILLAPQPAWAGQVTVLGQVVQGLETAKGLSRVRSSGPGGVPAFRPIDPVKIQKVLITKRNSPIAGFSRGPLAPPESGQEFVDLSWGSPYIQSH